MKRLKIHLYLVGLSTLLLLFRVCIGQELTVPNPYFFEHYSIEKGLSQGSGYAVASFDNFIWAGTQDGLNRFDGHEFRVYKSNHKHSVRDNFIQCLLADQRGYFWVGTVKGVDLYNKNTDQFASFSETFGIRHPVNDLAIKKFLNDRKGNLWIMSDERGIYCFNPATKQSQTFLETSNNLMDLTLAPDGTVWVVADDEVYFYNEITRKLQSVQFRQTLALPSSSVFRAIVSDASGRIWVGTYEDGIYVVDPSRISRANMVHFQKGEGATQLSSNQITCFYRDKTSRIWIGSRTEGVMLFRSHQQDFVRLKHSDKVPRSLGANYVISFFEDKQANMWIGLSGSGLDKFDPRNAPFHLIRHDDDSPNTSLPDNMVFKLFAQGQNLYVGTQSKGLVRYSMASEQIKTFPHIPNSQVYDIDADSIGRLWLATGGGLCQFQPKTQQFSLYRQRDQKPLLYLYALKVLRNQQEIWTGGQRGLYRFNLQTKTWTTWANLPAIAQIATYVIRIIYEDSEQNIWLGTLGHGLIKYNAKTRQVTVIDQQSGLACNNIRSILEQGQKLWVGTDCGLFCLDRASMKVQRQYNEQDGLPNNVIYGILSELRGYLWLSSNQGLTRFNPATRYVKNYDVNHGLQSNEFNTNCAYSRPDGTFYFGGVKGISYFNIYDLKPNSFRPPVKLTWVKVLDSVYTIPQHSLTLPHTSNFIDFGFATLNFSNSEKNTYQYKLEGINPNWIQAGTRPYATFTNLPPGNYTFRVKGRNDDGVESPQEASIQIRIKPAFYQTWWFITLLTTLGVGLLWLAYRSHMSYQTMRAKLDREEAIRRQKESELNEQAAAFKLKLSETEMAGLRSQMNPHFIFNCLNSIQYYTAQNESEKASSYLTKFSRLIRLVLENSKSEKVNLANELETLRLYIDMEVMRFPDKLSYQIQVARNVDADAILIPPLLLQPYVENAVWHGLMHQEEGGTIYINVTQPKFDLLQVEIIDDGVGRQKAAEYQSKSAIKKKSFGMKITADRIELINQLYQIQTNVVITDLTDEKDQPTGTKVTLRIPV